LAPRARQSESRWPKRPPFMTSLTKKPASPKQKNFFRVQTRRLVASFETFTGSVEHTGLEKFPCKATCVWTFFFRKSTNPSGRQCVNLSVNIAKNTFPARPCYYKHIHKSLNTHISFLQMEIDMQSYYCIWGEMQTD